MRRMIIVGVAIAAAALGTGYVAGGHQEVISLIHDDRSGFHTDYYTCWQTTLFQVCEVLPSDLPRLRGVNEALASIGER